PSHNSAPGVLEKITGQLRRGRYNTGHVGKIKTGLRCCLPDGSPCNDNVALCLNLDFPLGRGVHCNFFDRGLLVTMSSARSTLSAVSMFPRVKPISVAVTATAGRIPAMIVLPPMRVTIWAVSETVLAKKESSVSTDEISRTTPLAS